MRALLWGLQGCVVGGILLASLMGSSPVFAANAVEGGPAADLSDLDLEQLTNMKVEKVYGASRFEQEVTEAPASVSIVTADEIKRYGWRTIADILRATRGFFATYDRNYSYIGVRGFNRPGDYNSRVLILIDGHRMNDDIYETAAIGTEFILDLALIDRIEIIRGPSSSLYGAGAFFGVINIITRSGRQIDGVEASAAGGSQDTYAGRLTYGKAYTTGGELVLSGSGYTSSGDERLFFPEFNDPATNNGVADNMDRDWNYSLFARGSIYDFTLTGALVYRDKRVPTASYGTIFNDPRTHTIDSRDYLDLKFERAIEGTNVLARLTYDEYRFKGSYAYETSAAEPVFYPPTYVNLDDHIGRWWGGEVQVSRQLLPRLHLTAGAQFRDNFQQDMPNYDLVPQGRRLDNSDSNVFWSLYGQGELRLLDSLILNAGVRYDHYQNFGGTTNPRVALIFTPVEKTIFKLIYGEAFRAPNAYELHYNDAYDSYVPNPALQPETITTYEVVYEQYYGDVLRTSASFFYNRISNLISFQDVNESQVTFQNVDRVKALGGEFEVEGHWSSGISARASYSYVDAQNDVTDQHLDYSPRQLAKLNLTVPVYRKLLFAGLELQGVSRREFIHNGVNSASAGYGLANFTLFSTGVIPGLEASGSIYNLLDKRFNDPATTDQQQTVIPQDGRTFRVQLTYHF